MRPSSSTPKERRRLLECPPKGRLPPELLTCATRAVSEQLQISLSVLRLFLGLLSRLGFRTLVLGGEDLSGARVHFNFPNSRSARNLNVEGVDEATVLRLQLALL